LTACRFISVQGTGVDAINVAEARLRGILVSNVPDFCSDAVAEHAWALLLAVAKRLEEGRPMLTAGAWQTALSYSTFELRGRTLGLFGCGKIGGRIAAIGRAFGMKVISTTRDAKSTPFPQLLEQADCIVISAPATPETRSRFNRNAFAAMKPGAILVNVSRAAVVEDAALLEALDSGRLAGAATDVFLEEPPAPNSPLLRHPKLLVSPHVAWGSDEAVQRLLNRSIDHVEAFLKGSPVNLVG
jgi:glycerate dehydrogenase